MLGYPEPPLFASSAVCPAADIPHSLVSARAALVAKDVSEIDLLRYAADAEEYIEKIFQYVLFRLPDPTVSTSPDDMLDRLLLRAGSLIMFEDVPWINSHGKRPDVWTLKNEIMVAVESLTSVLNIIAENTLRTLFNTEADDSTWKRPSGLLKKSRSFLEMLQLHQNALMWEVPSSIFELDFNCITLWTHMNNAALQLCALAKNVWSIDKSISDNFGDFSIEKMSKTTNFAMFVRIVIHAYNEIMVASRLVENEPYFKALKSFLECYLCFYLSLDSYKKDKVGLAIGLVNYALVLAQVRAEDKANESISLKDKVKSKLASKKDIKTARKLELDNMSSHKLSKRIVRSNVILNQSLESNLPQGLIENLKVMVSLFHVLNLKFNKENNNISFQAVVPISSISQSYLFGSSTLPSGIGVPVSSTTHYPKCVGNTESRNAYY